MCWIPWPGMTWRSASVQESKRMEGPGPSPDAAGTGAQAHPIAACIQAVKSAQRAAEESRRYEVYYEHVSALMTDLMARSWVDLRELVARCDIATLNFVGQIALGAAIFAVRSGDSKWLVLGLQALYLEDQVNDAHTTITKFTLLQNSAAKLGFHMLSIAYRIEKEPTDFIQSLLEAPPRTLRAIGYVEGKDPSGQFTYTLTG